MLKKKNEGEELYGELGQAFNFTQGDLEANRAGFMSFRQRRLQIWRLFAHFPFVLIMLVLFASPIPLLISFYSENGLSFGAKLFLLIVFFCLSVLPITRIIWITAVEVSKTFHDIRDSHVGKIVSSVSTIPRSVYRGVTLFLVAGEEEFELGSMQRNILWKPFLYKIYFLPHKRKILSLEEILPE
jgi:hypothetical protein